MTTSSTQWWYRAIDMKGTTTKVKWKTMFIRWCDEGFVHKVNHRMYFRCLINQIQSICWENTDIHQLFIKISSSPWKSDLWVASIPNLRLPVSSSTVYESRNYEFTHINAAHLPILGTVVQWDCTSLNDEQRHEKDISRKEGDRTYKKLS